jgi:hypothetical protein
MVTLKSAIVVPLTLEVARKHNNLTPMLGERELKPSRVQHFIKLIEAKKFRSPIWGVVVVKGSGKQHRADGQHTSHALISVPKEQFPVGSNVTIVTYEITSIEEDGAEVFFLFDNRKSARTDADAMGFWLSQHPDLHELSRAFAMAIANGVTYYLKDLNRRQKDPAEHAEIYEPQMHGIYFADLQYRAFAVWLHTFKGTKNDWLISKAAIVAEILEDWTSGSNGTAGKFWKLVFTESANVEHITRTLIDTLREYRSRPRRPKPAQFRNAVKKVWEQYCEEEGGKGKRRKTA